MNKKSAVAVWDFYKINIFKMIVSKHDTMSCIQFTEITIQGHGSKPIIGISTQSRICKINGH